MKNSTLYETFVNCTDVGMPLICVHPRCHQTVEWDMFLCTLHLQRMFGVKVAPSVVEGIGNGLIATRPIQKGFPVGFYGGETVSNEQISARYQFQNQQDEPESVTCPYAVDLDSETLTLDSMRFRGAASYCNDARGTSYQYNATLHEDCVSALRDIKAGEEIFVDYGEDYWSFAGQDSFDVVTTHERCPVQNLMQLNREQSLDIRRRRAKYIKLYKDVFES